MTLRSVLLITLFSAATLAQAPPAKPTSTPPPVRPIVKPTPADTSELTEAQMEQKAIESVQKPISWKRYSPPGFEISFEAPREPFRQTESFYDESMGRMKLEMHFSIGDGATFVVANMNLPYSITDRALVREMFQEMAKEIDPGGKMEIKDLTDLDFEGYPGVRYSLAAQSGFMSFRLHGFMMGRSMYLLCAMPHHSPPEDEPLSREDLSSYEKDNDRFFSSALLKKTVSATPTTAAPVSPVFSCSLAGDIFRSDYFKFSFKLPKGWIKLSEADVEGIRKVGREYIAATSDVATPQPKTRQNLATFVSKPLGNERVAMIAINLGSRSTQPGDTFKLAEVTEKLISKLPTYEIRKRPTPTTLAGIEAYTLETTIRMTDAPQYQVTFFLRRRDQLLAITVSYHDEVDRKAALAALEAMTFETL